MEWKRLSHAENAVWWLSCGRQKYFEGSIFCAAALLILKIVGTRHMQYFLKKKLCKICVLGCVDYYVILGDFRAESMQVMSTGHLHFPFTLRWELK